MRLLLETGGGCPGTDPGWGAVLWFLLGECVCRHCGLSQPGGRSMQDLWPLVGGHPPERQPAPQ